MTNYAPITTRAKKNGGITTGKSSCGCSGDCSCTGSLMQKADKTSPAKMCGPKHK
jgi:hypothetical protein|tara:strand:+ start:1225 stop:1389 length:165 start_codon:yes stop_codon:yes gene_type:complete